MGINITNERGKGYPTYWLDGVVFMLIYCYVKSIKGKVISSPFVAPIGQMNEFVIHLVRVHGVGMSADSSKSIPIDKRCQAPHNRTRQDKETISKRKRQNKEGERSNKECEGGGWVGWERRVCYVVKLCR